MSKKASSKEESTTVKNPDTLPSSIDKNTQQEKENRKFIILRSLGQGSFGKVKEALHVLTQEKLAIKILEKERVRKAEDLVRINREMLILTKVQHPNIIQQYEIIETRRYYFFVMEYAKRGEQSRYIKKMVRLSEPEACCFFQQIISGVEYLNKLGYAHRDIKPNNLLQDEDLRVKIIDFGLGNIYDKDQYLKTPCGSPCYAAPEVIAGEPYEPLKVDIWSSGITLFAMVCGYLPFDEENKATLYQKILSCEYKLPNYLSSSLRDLLSKIQIRNPAKRFDINDIKEHKWYKQLDNPAVRKKLNNYSSMKEIDTTINYPILKYAANLSGVDYKVMEKMLGEKDHNKFTTTYFQLIKKNERGELEEELKPYRVQTEPNYANFEKHGFKDDLKSANLNITDTFHRDRSRDTTDQYLRDNSRDSADKYRRDNSRDTADKYARDHSKDSTDKHKDKLQESVIKRQKNRSERSNDNGQVNNPRDSGHKINKREFSNRKQSADNYNNFDKTKNSNQNENIYKSKSSNKKSFQDESRNSAKKHNVHPENLDKTRGSSQNNNRSSKRNKTMVRNMEIMNIIEKYEEKENTDKPRDRKLVEREKITEREKWFSLDKTIKVKEKIIEKEKFENDIPQSHNKIDKLHNSHIVDTDRNTSFPTPKREGVSNNQPILGMNPYNQMGKKMEQKVIELKTGDINNEFPKLSQPNSAKTGSNFYNTSSSNKKFAENNNQENKHAIDFRRKSSNNSYTNWVTTKTNSSNNPTPVNFDKRNYSQDSNRNNCNVSPIRLDRALPEKYTHRISFDKRKVSGHLSNDAQSNKSQEYNYDRTQHGSGSKAISKVLKKIIDKHVPSKQNVKNFMHNTFNRSDKRGEDRSPEHDKLQIFCSRHDSIDLNNLTSYPKSNNNMSNGPNTTKVFRTHDGNGLIQSKSAFRTMQKNTPASTRGNKSVISKDKNNYLMNTYNNTKASPHPIKQIKNQAQTMKIDQTKLFSSFDERGSNHYHNNQQKKLDSSHISRNKSPAPEPSSNNNRIKINNLTLRMK